MKWKFMSLSAPTDGTAMIIVNDLGREGWDLVSVIFTPQRAIKDGSMTTFHNENLQFFFKMQISE